MREKEIIITPIIQEFINKFCIKCADNEDFATTELYMDNHHCINYNNQDYYLPEEISTLTEEESILYQMILNTYEL